MKLYASGGIFSITSRILVVDLLTFPNLAESITGIVVMHAEKVIATSVEAFILRIFRQKNQNGFIKAFSDIPEPFTTGFSPLTNMLKNLFLRTPLLWPRLSSHFHTNNRFQVDIATSLEPPSGSPPTVTELSIPLTPQMQKIQNSLLECIEVCLSELKRSNPTLDMEEWTADAALHRNFDVTVRRILDPIWHRVSWKTRTIVADLSLLRRILQ
jgi:DNA excision repair protein ERCC-4